LIKTFALLISTTMCMFGLELANYIKSTFLSIDK
jgi:hypothetical protein